MKKSKYGSMKMVRIEKLNNLLWLIHLEGDKTFKIEDHAFQAILNDASVKIAEKQNLTENRVLITLTKNERAKSNVCPKCQQKNKLDTIYCEKCSFRLKEGD